MLAFIKNNKKYAIYALSIVLSRGLEYFVLFYAAFFLSKEDYGELEYYKKVIELFAVALAFGLPSLLLTYTKSDTSKTNFTFLSFVFILILGVIIAPILYLFDYEFLLIPVLFHAIFFNNGIIPVFFITKSGSNIAAIYKSVISFAFYLGIFLLLLFSNKPYLSFVNVNYFIFPLSLIFVIKLFISQNISYRVLLKYYKLFKRLLLSSLTLVVSNFVNIMFLYTDIMIIKLISTMPNIDIADYSFVLNICNIMILIPLTIVQVDIEQIKRAENKKLMNTKILKLISIFSVLIIIVYFVLINTFYKDYQETIYMFIVILLAKFFQAQSVYYGAVILIFKKYNINLIINVFCLLLNIVLSYLFFKYFNVLGVAVASFLSLVIRYLALRHFSSSISK